MLKARRLKRMFIAQRCKPVKKILGLRVVSVQRFLALIKRPKLIQKRKFGNATGPWVGLLYLDNCLTPCMHHISPKLFFLILFFHKTFKITTFDVVFYTNLSYTLYLKIIAKLYSNVHILHEIK